MVYIVDVHLLFINVKTFIMAQNLKTIIKRKEVVNMTYMEHYTVDHLREVCKLNEIDSGTNKDSGTIR